MNFRFHFGKLVPINIWKWNSISNVACSNILPIQVGGTPRLKNISLSKKIFFVGKQNILVFIQGYNLITLSTKQPLHGGQENDSTVRQSDADKI